MPIYAYRCDSCGVRKDVLQKIADAPLAVCTECGAATFHKELTAPAFQLKGSGWYATDFRDNGKPKEKAAGDAAGAEQKGAGDAASPDGGKTEAGKAEAGKAESGKAEAGKGEAGKSEPSAAGKSSGSTPVAPPASPAA